MATRTPETPESKRRQWTTLVAFLLLSVFMYVSIMYKIMHYGP
jgi:hypothetical protein